MALHNNAYQNGINTATKSVKDTEINVILDVTRKLKAANDNRKENFANFALALRDNCKLWTTLAGDVAKKENLLSPDLRAKIFYLCEFTQIQSRKALSDQTSADAMIDINMAILRGLAPKTGAA